MANQSFKKWTLGVLCTSFIAGFAQPSVAFELPFTKKPHSQQQQNQVETIFIAVDGFSYYAFMQAQKMGLFKDFANFGAHVSPFPSMTDLSWATVTHTANIFGDAGRIRSVEATYFDESSKSIQGDPRDYYRRLAFPKYYMGAFDTFFNPYVEALMYFPTEEVPKLEMKTVVDDLLAAKPKKVLTGYVGAVDSTAHTQLNRLFPILRQLDSELKRLKEGFKAKGQNPEIILVSDHGNIGRFKEGEQEQELLGIELNPIIERAGLKSVQALREQSDVAVPLLALGTWAPVYVKDRVQLPKLIQEFSKEAWFDMSVILNFNSADGTGMTIYTKDSEAKITFNKKTQEYNYIPVRGNPLQIPVQYHSSKQKQVAIDSQTAFTLTSQTKYPDSLFRIIESASERNFDFPDLILTLKDGYYIKSGLGSFTKMYRTHGSLTAASSFGLVASTSRRVPGQMRSKDILPFFGIDPKKLFGDIEQKHNKKPQQTLAELKQTAKAGIATDAKDLSQKRIFRHISKFVADTRPYFLVSEMKSFMEAFKFDPFKSNTSMALSPMNFDSSKFDVSTMISPEDIGSVTDAVLTAGSVENLMKDPRVNAVKEKIPFLKDSKTNQVEWSEEQSQQDILSKVKRYTLPAKRSVMKMYQIPYLLENSIVIQEKQFLPEVRDLGFAGHWLSNKEKLNSSPKGLNAINKQTKLSNAMTLLKETIKEAELEGRIYPTQLDKLYNPKAEDITVVYVPGIYNSIFDKEIFSLGLNAIADDMGVRVISPPVEATCASDINADVIVNYLKEDRRTRVARGHKSPKYIFFSYSKGAVDTLHAFVKAPQLISSTVRGMISIAGGLHGSSILNTTDLPFALVSALSENEGPKICQKDKPAAKSITPTAMEAFWRKNERSLIGLTRYFSVSFESSPEDSHIFMKATKIIGQFDEDNDGVLTVSSTKFPAALQAVDLGVIHADHLAGILSSRFNQKAFMKGLMTAALEMNIQDDAANKTWNVNTILAKANEHYIRDRRYYSLKSDGIIRSIGTNSDNIVDLSVFSDTWELNAQLLPKQNDPADSYEPKVKLPQSQIKFDPYAVLDVQKLPDVMAQVKVNPATTQNMPDGIKIIYDHKNMVHFRMDHQFNYESRSPGGLDDNQNFGYVTADFNGEKNWALMRSQNNSIRMTTLAYRFSPLDFSKMNLKMAITKDVTGADPVKGKTGKDDSAFQLWFTIRDGLANGDRTTVDPKNDKVFLFGYYWGGTVPNENRPAGAIYENWYSNKNIVVATLPEAKQLLLNSQDMLGKAQVFQRNLAEDLKKAFPNRDVSQMEIVAITIQHDSNDTESSSETYFKGVEFNK